MAASLLCHSTKSFKKGEMKTLVRLPAVVERNSYLLLKLYILHYAVDANKKKTSFLKKQTSKIHEKKFHKNEACWFPST